MKIGLVDYGGGNLRSVQNALHALGYESVCVDSEKALIGVTHLILPGQGEFSDVITRLRDRGLFSPLQQWIQADKPYFGICVGYQILFEGSDEAPEVEGLSVIKGRCFRFPEASTRKIPQMGWNSAIPQEVNSPYWNQLGEKPYFYFVHSYFPVPEDESWVTSQTDYDGQTFAASVEKGQVLACQFHPEKSQEAGLLLMENFLSKNA